MYTIFFYKQLFFKQLNSIWKIIKQLQFICENKHLIKIKKSKYLKEISEVRPNAE